jgi:hypothetical protein
MLIYVVGELADLASAFSVTCLINAVTGQKTAESVRVLRCEVERSWSLSYDFLAGMTDVDECTSGHSFRLNMILVELSAWPGLLGQAVNPRSIRTF